MDDLHARIKQLERRRIEYFLGAPGNSVEQYSRDIREEISDLLQEIPLNISADTKQYLVGKILNIGPDYESKCEEQLEQSLRANSTRTDAWLELGQCVWKKGDMVKAHACFKEAIERTDNEPSFRCLPKACCLLSAALRALSNRCVDSGQRVQMLNESLQLCQEALRRRKAYPFAYYSLANTFLARFFELQQCREDDLSLALNAFASALKFTTNSAADVNKSSNNNHLAFINPDLHLNYGLALYYNQCYAKALAQFRTALSIEPHFGQAKRQLDSAHKFLHDIREGLRRKGSIAKRRLRTFIDTFPKQSATLIAEQQCVLRMKPARTLAVCSTLDDLIGASSSSGDFCAAIPSQPAATIVSSVTVRCVGFVANEEKIPSVLICVDRTAAVVALTIYNCSSKFGALIGDTFTVIQPNIIRVRWQDLALDDEKEGQIGAGKSTDIVDENSGGATNGSADDAQPNNHLLLMIRVINPSRQLLKNGKQLSSLDCAFASMSIETQMDSRSSFSLR